MDYLQIYNALVARARPTRDLDYGEWHHVLPRCMGGSDDASNLVFLTAREHFISHALLAKIHANTIHGYKLASAFNMMCADGQNGRRHTSRLFALARVMFSRNHPCKQPEIREKIRKSVQANYDDPVTGEATKEILRNANLGKIRKSIPRETRTCACGCGGTFVAKMNSTQQLLHGHHTTDMKASTGAKVSTALTSFLASLTEDEIRDRMQNSCGTCDHEARAKAISESKRGKTTNQQQIMGERYSKMTDLEFSILLQGKPPMVVTRSTNLRNRYINANNDN